MKIIKKTAAALCAAMTFSAGAFAAPLAPELQIDVLTKTAMVYNGWFVLPEREKNSDEWSYAIADLDQNGRLEVLKVKPGWVEGGPRLLCKELTEDGSRLLGEIALDHTAVPDLLATSDTSGQALVLYDAKKNLYHYIFKETVYHTEYESITTKYALTFSDGTLLVSPLAHYQWILSGREGGVTERYYLPKGDSDVGMEIGVARYNDIENEAFPGCEVRGVAFWWRSAKELKEAASIGRLRDALAQSYSSFVSGRKAESLWNQGE
ncbi:MAG: hypothetical protein J5477_03280 [Schwartzia sp.]|nr:hypothetical protein [Schwartzia sp. (in: firmicutes)]